MDSTLRPTMAMASLLSAGLDGIVGYGNYDGGFFSGTDAGTYSESQSTDAFQAAAYGSQYGSSGEGIGVYGWSASNVGIGVYGVGETSSATGANTDSGYYPMGVWGDSGAVWLRAFGSADDGWAPSWATTTVLPGLRDHLAGESGDHGPQRRSSAVYLWLRLRRRVYGRRGNLGCTGSVSAVAAIAGGSKKVALNGIASPEHWFEDAGSGQLSSGEAVINIESIYGETVNTGMDYHVFLTLGNVQRPVRCTEVGYVVCGAGTRWRDVEHRVRLPHHGEAARIRGGAADGQDEGVQPEEPSD